MQWYYSKNASQLGPVSFDELKAKLASGEVSPTDMVWREGMPDWRKAVEMPELVAQAVVTAAPSGVPQAMPTSVQTPYQPPVSQGYGANMNIQTYLWQSIVVTFLCCVPFGIPAIVYAAKVDGLKARGDIAGAVAASSNAKKWCIIAAVCGLIFTFLVVGAQIFAALSTHGAVKP